MTKPIPKSLHTVTSAARVALHLLENGADAHAEPYTMSNREAVWAAFILLGYEEGTPDPYDLQGKALVAMKALAKGART